ncbi:zf-HC2 domain-containing protein [Actinoplanes sp. Pm04-4]|uniref:Zf-HC2 domain-containing protein n=2 Tax=Paractinoplanes pyxinae TaxID=2997416 RepID=A0ABT4ASS3_9ACTN|nr:zf-HC2 domain-containing protein [Actinoplanes pyxinae]MCY1137296.1 zf-HC2 domain-containing protein [Actinoplanes pyxinae]
MACERWREMLSAQLDGEDDPADRPAVEAHLAGCAGCREWLDRAASVNRLTSTSMATPPDLSAAILAALPGKRDEPAPAGRWRGLPLVGRVPWGRFPLAAVLIVALAVVGAVQLILGLDQIGGGVVGAHVHTGLDATPGHLWHESAAWNVAVGAGYLFIALRRTRPSGLVPMLTAFVGMLLLLSVNDLTAARVDLARLISHGFVILGYLLIVALSRIPGGFVTTPPGARVAGGGAWRASFNDEDDDERFAEPFRPGLRLVPPGPMTAHHDERRAA